MLEFGLFENFGFEILGVRFQPIYLVAIYFLKSLKFEKKELLLIAILVFHCLIIGDIRSLAALMMTIFWMKFFSDYKIEKKSGYIIIWFIYILTVYELVFKVFIASEMLSFRSFSSEQYFNRLTLTFSEPSFTGVYLSVLAIIMYFKNRKINFLILLTLVLLTKSIGGIALLIFSFFIFVKKGRLYAMLLFIPMIILTGDRIISEFAGFGDLNAYNSLATRLNTILVFVEYLVFNGIKSLIGLGLGNVDTYLISNYSYLDTEFSVGNFANGFLAIIMSFGLFCIPFFMLLKKYSVDRSIFAMMLFALLLNGNLNSYILWLPIVLNRFLLPISDNMTE